MSLSRLRLRWLLAAVLLVALGAGSAWAQKKRRRGDPIPPGGMEPKWTNPIGFERDVFTFVRIKYGTHGRRGHPYGERRWQTDYPDADLNFAFRLQQMTSMKVDPQGKVIELTDPELFRHPFIYIVEPGDLGFSEEEVLILRRYLLGGGSLMVDDFWGEDEWQNLENEMARVFPDRKFQDIPRNHPLFSCVFKIPEDLNLQCPNVVLGTASQFHHITWEKDDAQPVHIRAIYDDKQRIMVIATHNTDNGDGWEREGENEYYFREFSEKKAYPLGINILFYLMTH